MSDDCSANIQSGHLDESKMLKKYTAKLEAKLASTNLNSTANNHEDEHGDLIHTLEASMMDTNGIVSKCRESTKVRGGGGLKDGRLERSDSLCHV